jgi:putative protease
VSVYRRAIDLYYKKNLTKEITKNLLEELETVYNRGFSSGFYFGKPSSEEYAGVSGSKATTRKVYVGKVLNYFKKPKAAHILIETGKIKLDDELLIIGETTGVVEMKLGGLSVNDKPADSAERGNEVTFISPKLVRKNDKVYLIEYIN